MLVRYRFFISLLVGVKHSFLLHLLDERWSVLFWSMSLMRNGYLPFTWKTIQTLESEASVLDIITFSVPDKALSCALQLCVQCCREDREPQSCTKSSKQFLIRTNPPAIVQLGVPPIRVLIIRVLNKTAWKNLPDSYLYSRLRLEVKVLGARKALQFDNVLKTTLKARGQS